ncbi:hypothetical protein NADFUDRAFT_77113 [Nadsonia fulvescens var. elongata DSM 6958]|uniref:Exonuclease V, mitochondrial n=1 Tax=Nadsonia fulvescens var. elongata DSM 6958 TaxID=857566 RepID=A0A1E3PQG0_9ASCO|nr:hypothetical protein NADFUDRAFT_77113 [Nadsonia fulvescens var. elongata DSM 6958]
MRFLSVKFRKWPYGSAPLKPFDHGFYIRGFSQTSLQRNFDSVSGAPSKHGPIVRPLEDGHFRLCLELPGNSTKEGLIEEKTIEEDIHARQPIYKSPIKKWLDENPDRGEEAMNAPEIDSFLDKSKNVLRRAQTDNHVYRHHRLKNMQKFTTKYIRPHPVTGLLPLQPQLGNANVSDSFNSLEPSSSSPYDLFRSMKNRLTVTDMTTQYCEVRSFYELCGLKRTFSKQVEAGTKYHKELEDLVAETIDIKQELIASKEDDWWLKFQRIQTMLEALIRLGSTREVYVFAKIATDKVVTGIIDELQLVDKDGNQLSDQMLNDIALQYETSRLLRNKNNEERNNRQIPEPVKWYVKLTDTKTRGRKSFPPESQKLSAYHQLLIYHNIFSSITASTVDNINDILINNFGLDTKKPVSSDITALLFVETGIDFSGVNTLEKIVQECVQPLFNFFNQKIYHDVEVDYVHTFKQKNSHKASESIGRIVYQFSQLDLTNVLDFRLDFWNGVRDPIGVGYDEMQTKCTNCPFKDNCKWRHDMGKKILK